jgi:phosphatidylglycerophosphate synthase
VNLPNSLTVGRIAIMPLIAWLPFTPSPAWRMVGFALFIIAAVTDYYDGMLARTRNSVTDLGRLLDPLADKLLLLGTMLPMYVLMAPRGETSGVLAGIRDAGAFPFVTPVGDVPLPWWIIAVVLGRELFMTVFRQLAARRGLVISAIGPAKWKMGFQCTWVGAAYFWFSAATAAERSGWSGVGWTTFAMFNGIVGTIAMVAAFGLTLASLWLYMRRYGPFVLLRRPAPAATTGAGRGPGQA